MFDTHAHFRILHAELDPIVITRQLDLHPNESWRKGDLVTKSRRESRYGVWMLSTEKIVKSDEIDMHLEWLIAQLKEKTHLLVHYRSIDYQTIVRCCWVSHGTVKGLSISKENLKGLAELGVNLIVDHYPIRDTDE